MKKMMIVMVVFAVTACVAALEQKCVFSQGGAGAGTGGATPTTSGPDTGEITGSPATLNRVKCWVSRTNSGGPGAVAVSVFSDGSNLSAKLRRYTKEEEEYSSTVTKIKVPGTATIISLSVVPVKLVPVAGYENTFDMMYEATSPSQTFSVGYLKFIRGNAGRSSSDVVIRVRNIEGVIDPCNKPPIDDMGEEEEVPLGSSAYSPGPSLPFNAPVVP